MEKPQKIVVITGASRGIGLAAAKVFLKNDWKVIGTYKSNEIPIDSPNLVPIKLDLGSRQSISDAVNAIREVTSTINVLANNAAIAIDANDESLDIDKMRITFEIDLFAVIDWTNTLLPLMKPKSHIINIDSAYGAQSFPINDRHYAGYRMAKAALNMYTRVLAYHQKTNGIIVSALDPGWVNTDMGIAVSEDERPDRVAEEPAQEIFDLATNVTESGYFWLEGKKREW